jgi:hypothetical protein
LPEPAASSIRPAFSRLVAHERPAPGLIRHLRIR